MVENNQRNILKNSSGFTLIELIVSALIGLLVIFLAYNSFISQDKGFKKEGRKIDALQNGRNTVDVLTRDLRILGVGVPESISEKITVANYQSITYLANFWNISTRLASRAQSGDTTLAVEDSTGFVNGQVIYICSDNSASVAITLASDPPNSTTINLPAALTGDYPTGCPVSVVDTVTYGFNGGAQEVQRTLLPVNGLNSGVAEALAENIDYMQFKFYDGGGSEISSIGSNLSLSERAGVRKIEMTVVAIPQGQDKTTATVTYEDGTSKTDGYYRVYLESDIKLRNMY